jgi:hypothetical protein
MAACSVADARQHRLEGDARQLQRGAFEIDHVVVRRSLQRQRDHIGSEQRLESRVVIVALGRDLDVDFVALAVVVPDKCKARIAPAQFAVDGVDHAGPGAMNGMKFNLVEAFAQFASLAVVDWTNCTLWPGRAPDNPAHRKSRDHQHQFSNGRMTGRVVDPKRGLMDRDARRRAPHHEGLRPHP